MSPHVAFMPFSTPDLALLDAWLNRPHVGRWYPHSDENIEPKNVPYPTPASRFGSGLSQLTPVSVVIKNSHARCQTAVGLNCSAVAVAHC